LTQKIDSPPASYIFAAVANDILSNSARRFAGIASLVEEFQPTVECTSRRPKMTALETNTQGRVIHQQVRVIDRPVPR
jgi:hypothetical protein